ncbi:uncharacterized protein LOC144026221 [Festucalex cinctus]
MMKCVFALVLLLHFCYSADDCVNFNLRMEMIGRLDRLNKLYKTKPLFIASPDAVLMPSAEMCQNADFCVEVFSRELGTLLSNVTVHPKNENILTELKKNLQLLRPCFEQADHECEMEANAGALTPFKPYMTFLRKLNESKR